MTCCFTGHRHFPWGDDTESPHHKDLLAGLENAVDWALVEGVTHFICGNAAGVDTWAAEMVLQKKKAHPEIFLEIALPFAGHNADEPACQLVQRQADLVHVVGKSKYRKAAFSERNRYMVDHSDFLIAVYMESHPRSGTAKQWNTQKAGADAYQNICLNFVCLGKRFLWKRESFGRAGTRTEKLSCSR